MKHSLLPQQPRKQSLSRMAWPLVAACGALSLAPQVQAQGPEQAEWPSSRHGGSGRPKTGNAIRNVKSSQGGGSIFMFADGHAEFIKQDAAVARTPDMRKRWNADNEPHL